MMLYPSVQELTNDKVNRYALVIATAKGARLIAQKAFEEREKNEEKRESDHLKDYRVEVTCESVNEKAVTKAIDRIFSGEYKIVTE